ncbi:unnamed protein product [Lactuca virosa]|uniref:Uncharacterized protein n=1 Tax=Lactuca virosa TaxID=75947 RepID=A0AAU9LX98_9ASTR|nr:unnamed protein product [Lactuca virosa]
MSILPRSVVIFCGLVYVITFLPISKIPRLKNTISLLGQNREMFRACIKPVEGTFSPTSAGTTQVQIASDVGQPDVEIPFIILQQEKVLETK